LNPQFVTNVVKWVISGQIAQNMMGKILVLVAIFLDEDVQILIKTEHFVIPKMKILNRLWKLAQVLHGQPRHLVLNDGAKAVTGPAAWQVLKGPSLLNRRSPFWLKQIGMFLSECRLMILLTQPFPIQV
jgi:hypothetical protein